MLEVHKYVGAITSCLVAKSQSRQARRLRGIEDRKTRNCLEASTSKVILSRSKAPRNSFVIRNVLETRYRGSTWRNDFLLKPNDPRICLSSILTKLPYRMSFKKKLASPYIIINITILVVEI